MRHRRPVKTRGGQRRPWSSLVFRGLPWSSLVFVCLPYVAHATAAENYNPSWGNELNWASQPLFLDVPGSRAYWVNNYLPWWQTDVAHPVMEYDASKLQTGGVRLDGSLENSYTLHRTLRGWTSPASPSNINNVYTFSPGSQFKQDRTARDGQAAFMDLGIHPIQPLSADIGAEFIGNYDQRYWFPVNDEHRMYNADRWGKIVRTEGAYTTEPFTVRGFYGVPVTHWLNQNDLFELLPTQADVEHYRVSSGEVTPRGGEMRAKTALGTFDAIGGSEIRWGYGSSAFGKWDLPTFGNWENSFVYRNENIPWGQADPDERRWSVSYNTSYAFSDRTQGHLGVLYQPFRLDRPYQDIDGAGNAIERTTKRSDAFGGTVRMEFHPTAVLDLAGLGYTYEGPVAGNKQQVDINGTRLVAPNWTLSAAYTYRQPLRGPVPLSYEGTPDNPGAFISIPRGPDDPFTVDWSNRKAHLMNVTLVFDPTPGTPFFKYQPNVLDDWNLNPDEDSTWTGALQYRAMYYPTNTDRLFFYNENRVLIWEPIGYSNTGALATSYPYSAGTALLRFNRDKWHITGDASTGQALAGLGSAYKPATDADKPSTIFVNSGLTVGYDVYKAYFRYSQDVWGPMDYQIQNGWAYHRIYQAGFSADFLRDFQVGARWTGTRMTNDFIGSDIGAFNEYTFYLTYHFSLEHNFSGPAPTGTAPAARQPVPRTAPQATVSVSNGQIIPDGNPSERTVQIYPHASAEAGLLSYQVLAQNANGETVRKWEGGGTLPASLEWDGMDATGKPVPAGVYRISVKVTDLYGGSGASPASSVEVRYSAPPAYQVHNTPEGLKVTLSSMILFDTGKTDIKTAAEQALQQVTQLLKAYPTNTLRISGYTDSTGSRAYNQKLSELRAKAVAHVLMQQGGISGGRLKIQGYGPTHPVASNATEEGRQQNRRVEIDILK